MTQIFQSSLTYDQLQGYLSDGFAYQGVAFGGYGSGQWSATPIVQLWKNVPVSTKYSKYGEVAWVDYQQTSILIPQSVYENALTAPLPTFTTPVEPSATLPAQAGTVANIPQTTPNTIGTGQPTNALAGAGGLIILALVVFFLGRKKWKF